MQSNIVLTVQKSEADTLISAFQSNKIDFEYVESCNFDGLSELAQIILSVTATTIPLISPILIEFIRSKKQVSVKYKQIELKGLTVKEASAFLDKVMKKEKNS